MLSYLLLLLLLLFMIGAIGLYLIRKTPYGLLDPKVAIALKLMPERKEGISVTEQRAQMRKMVDKYNKEIPLLRVENQTISAGNQSIPIRIYSDSKEENLPILIYYHGGGWVVGDLETHDGICAIAAPIFNQLKQPVAALVILIPATRSNTLENPELINQLKSKAALISNEISKSRSSHLPSAFWDREVEH